MFPAVISPKLEAAIAKDEERKRKKARAEQGKVEAVGSSKGARTSEFETLLNQYSKIEADEIAVSVFGPYRVLNRGTNGRRGLWGIPQTP